MFFIQDIEMTLYDILYKILKKAKEHQSPLPTGDFLFNELKEELDLTEFRFKFFLEDLAEQGYIKLKKENIADWGEVEILQSGISYVDRYVPNEHTDVNYKNFWAFVEKQIIKHTDDLVMAKEGAELHLKDQEDILERQKSLANRGLRNCWDFQQKQVSFARHEVYRINKVIERRKILAQSTDNTIGGHNTETQQQFNATLAKAMAEINKKNEQKAKDSEERKKEIFREYVDQTKHWCNSLEKFKRWIKTDSITLSTTEFLLKLRDYEVQYSNALFYYTQYGPEHLMDAYEQIKAYILEQQSEIFDNTDKAIAQTKTSPPIIKQPETLEPITDKLNAQLVKYGFYTLDPVKTLNESEAKKLIELLVVNELPYKIAMLDYLGFIAHLEKEHFQIKNELYTGIAEILNTDNRSVKGNILVLNPISRENKERYTAHLHKETVDKDYLKIK